VAGDRLLALVQVGPRLARLQHGDDDVADDVDDGDRDKHRGHQPQEAALVRQAGGQTGEGDEIPAPGEEVGGERDPAAFFLIGHGESCSCFLT